MAKIFVDTDICLDLLSGRKPFNAIAQKLFTLADLGKIKIYVSSLSFSNIDYILKSNFKQRHKKNSCQIQNTSNSFTCR